MKIVITLILIINNLLLLTASEFCNNKAEFENITNCALNKEDYLEVIIDDSHAYTFLNCTSCNNGQAYSIYSSLMPKGNSANETIFDRLPKPIQWLLEGPEEAVVAIHFDYENPIVTFPNGTSVNYSGCSNFSYYPGAFRVTYPNGTEIDYHYNHNHERTLPGWKLFAIFVVGKTHEIFSDYFKSSGAGEVVNSRPHTEEIVLQKRFYLTKAQAEKAMNWIGQAFQETKEGKTIYVGIIRNCIDYAKELYEMLGLEEIEGPFLSHFVNPEYDWIDNPENGSIIDQYGVHRKGEMTAWNILRKTWKEAWGR